MNPQVTKGTATRKRAYEAERDTVQEKNALYMVPGRRDRRRNRKARGKIIAWGSTKASSGCYTE